MFRKTIDDFKLRVFPMFKQLTLLNLSTVLYFKGPITVNVGPTKGTCPGGRWTKECIGIKEDCKYKKIKIQ